MIEIYQWEDYQNHMVEKKWGSELIIHNDDDYCGKLLKFNKGGKFSMHFHMQKKETWYVKEGEFILRYIDTENATTHTERIGVNTIVEIYPGDPHQLIALTEGLIFEISTEHFDTDSYRIEKGDSQC